MDRKFLTKIRRVANEDYFCPLYSLETIRPFTGTQDIRGRLLVLPLLQKTDPSETNHVPDTSH